MNTDVKSRRPILLVEDEMDYAALVKESFRDAQVANPIYSVSSGEEAIHYLAGEGKFANRVAYPLPALVLLDLRLQGKSGFDVLRWLSERPAIKRAMSIVALSSLETPNEVRMAYELGAQLFMKKPDLEGLREKARYLKSSWLEPAF